MNHGNAQNQRQQWKPITSRARGETESTDQTRKPEHGAYINGKIPRSDPDLSEEPSLIGPRSPKPKKASNAAFQKCERSFANGFQGDVACKPILFNLAARRRRLLTPIREERGFIPISRPTAIEMIVQRWVVRQEERISAVGCREDKFAAEHRVANTPRHDAHSEPHEKAKDGSNRKLKVS